MGGRRGHSEKASMLQRGLIFLQECFAELECRGLEEEGLYRLPGQSNLFLALYKSSFEKGQPIKKVCRFAILKAFF